MVPKKEKDVVTKALADAKKLEKQELRSSREIAEQYGKDMAMATSAAKLLKRTWFVSGNEPEHSKKARMQAKKRKRQSKPSRKRVSRSKK